MLHGCPPSPDAWGRLNVVTPFHHLSGDSHINSSLREGPLRHLVRRHAEHRAPEEDMKGVVFLGDRKLELREFPDPTPGPRDVILEIKASGMCGSDLHTYRAPANPGGVVTGAIKRAAGVIAGHEPCGVVAAVGTAVTDKEARIGQRVMDHHYDGCGNCKHCRAGWTQMCLEGPVVYGSGGHGGHAKYMKVPVSTLVP